MLTLTDISRLFSANLSAVEVVLKSTATSAISTQTGLALTESEPFTTQSVETSSLSSNHETTSDSRFQKAANPVFKYDFKVGNYLPDTTKTLNQHLFSTLNDVTGGIRKAPWFYSDGFFNSFKVDVFSYLAYFSTSSFFNTLRDQYSSASAEASTDFMKDGAYLAAGTPTAGFYNLCSSFVDNSAFLNER